MISQDVEFFGSVRVLGRWYCATRTVHGFCLVDEETLDLKQDLVGLSVTLSGDVSWWSWHGHVTEPYHDLAESQDAVAALVHRMAYLDRNLQSRDQIHHLFGFQEAGCRE